jgi:hypothetical protein
MKASVKRAKRKPVTERKRGFRVTIRCSRCKTKARYFDTMQSFAAHIKATHPKALKSIQAWIDGKD